MKYKYLTKVIDGEEFKEVSLDEYIQTEKNAGFRGPGHHKNPKEPATDYFVGYNGLSGKVVIVNDNKDDKGD